MPVKSNLVVTMLAVTLLTGCGSISRITTMTSTVSEQQRNFSAGIEKLKAGDEKGARLLLERVIEAAPLRGVTDEALFRLALLSLRDEGIKGAARAQALLEHLRTDYPRSTWTRQAAPLISYLSGIKSLRAYQREVRILREHNSSLNRDNRDLRQTIERLKSLDLEMEQTIRR